MSPRGGGSLAHAAEAYLRDVVAGPDAEAASYVRFHLPRYRLLLGLVDQLLAERRGGDEPALLDVGASWLTQALRASLPGVRVDSLGFDDDRFPPRAGDAHVLFDLNLSDAVDPTGTARYDVVVLAEVLEHLHVAPELVLGLLGRMLRPGGTLIVQTPNACSLTSRIWMLAGRNPLEPIRASRHNPGHFHEYTLRELCAVGRGAGLELVGWRAASYFRPEGLAGRALARAGPALPRTLREGLTVWYRTPR